MSSHDITHLESTELRKFTKALLNDLRALERMVHDGLFESGVRRIGAEQELFLVDKGWRPAPVATEVLEGLSRPEFTTELARFNIEINLLPLVMDRDCFKRLEQNLNDLIAQVRREAAKHKAAIQSGCSFRAV